MKTPGQIAYEADCAAKPSYHDGKARTPWEKIGRMAQESWNKNPTPRNWKAPICSVELTPIGEQYVIPGCEQRRDKTGSAPRQPSLWDKQ